ncbi:MAG: hypothetical protein CGU28_15360 [Candidatus Dactylopiibacterium carminicum]|uniref:Short-chain dehydrogenase n=1 Tax=Candidatus Dactylopiibacterium carminicum TaxID=857335 RepID=A0A272EN84_9RHOO|nr:SDR family NAD(P)-dependent oxidoreductase [Candidatus Dactylopiibacterium carminicum]KAF7598016.1 hypothetical protein BGI27_15510 [Candidatus Dactylopiibacterium carminicum]PAS91584.1 MAG: hypothetical protein CGU29_15685 [Candidatus Dactylopiibacterium carminicum]PAS93288.1 MAG: hypothetical protein CGU28_15360 [Candidatus Dactylopiibacterium carminicum]PAS96330.1 MAG: hypothetical protein BSR46_15545 [Candidatus Dactylopiibacterium carminicum]
MIVLVSGASAGFGAAISRRFLEAGHAVIAVARRKERLQALQEEFPGHPLHIVELDVSQREAVLQAISTLPSDFSHIDLLVNNAGLDLAFHRDGTTAAIVNGNFTPLPVPVFANPPALRPASAVREWVLENAGARPWDRDEIDRRLIAQIRAGEGRIIDSQDEVGGYPRPAPVHRSLDVPVRDIESWLRSFVRSQD